MRILVTGASGVIGRVIVQYLAERCDVVALDKEPGRHRSTRVVEVQCTLSDSPALTSAMDGCSHVVHLARGDPQDWRTLAEVDIQGTRAVMHEAAEQGVERVVFASSNNVTGGYERDLWQTRAADLSSTELFGRPRPNSEYAVAKLFGENYGRLISETTSTAVSCLRIGTVRAIDDPARACDEPGFEWIPGGSAAVLRRLQSTWLTHSDLCAIMTEEIDATDRYRVRYAVSDNPGRYWPLEVITE